MPPVHRCSRLLTREELVDDLIARAQSLPEEGVPEEGTAGDSEERRPAPDNETLLRKAAGAEATEEIRRRRFCG
jgi:hypothetical protein